VTKPEVTAEEKATHLQGTECPHWSHAVPFTAMNECGRCLAKEIRSAVAARDVVWRATFAMAHTDREPFECANEMINRKERAVAAQREKDAKTIEAFTKLPYGWKAALSAAIRAGGEG